WQVMPNHIHLIIELGEYNYNNGIANVDDDNVIENGNAADGGNVVGCGNTNATNATAQPSMVVQSRLQTNQ
ncbi:MAG: hypothetical protein JXR50_02830, partial [Prolixibacteraceae bacterium]|nr:hypothetical protein [Prolixibacteraceae bacterium]